RSARGIRVRRRADGPGVSSDASTPFLGRGRFARPPVAADDPREARDAMTEEHRGRPAVTGRILAALLVGGLAAGVRADAPLTTADVVRFLKAGISERLILSELKDRGFTDPLDSANENALREAGASETLVVAIRRVAPEPPPLPSSPVTPPKTPRGGDPPLIVM